ncbi:MAG TPA: NADH-quinone oxidoreductase subunit L [Elusimicrobia bacterium]|nr:NADH-quinone oxidoreductase subunit L [Elusimicrobiota bacterium]
MTISLLQYMLIPLFSALLIPFVARRRGRLAEIFANVTLLAGLINIGWTLMNPAVIASGFSALGEDGFSLLMIFTVYLVGLCVTFFSASYGNGRGVNTTYFYPLLLVSVAAMCGAVTSTDFFTLFIFVEVLAVASFALITSDDTKEGIEGAIKYYLLTFPASAAIMLGLAVMLLSAGTFSFDSVRIIIYSGTSAPALVFSLSLMLLGFLVKSGVVPFHVWTPDAYQGSYAPVSAFLAGIVTKVSGVYAVIRIAMFLRLFETGAFRLSEALMFLGMVSIAVGAIAAMRQDDFKRMLAFSSISQVGYIVLAAGLATPLAFIGAIFHLFNHATFKTVLFLNSASLEKAAGTRDMNKLGGMEHPMPWTSWTSVIAMLSTAGVPPLSGFWSKIIIIIALWDAGAVTYAVLALLFSALTLGYFVVMQRRIFFGKKSAAAEAASEVSPALLAPAVLMSAVIVAAGLLFPYFFSFLAETIASRMVL